MRISISGLTGKRLLVFVFLLFLTGIAFGADHFTVTPPTFIGSDPDEVQKLNDEADKAFKELKDSLNETFSFLPYNLDKLAGGFANASVFSSDGASQRGYEGFNAFSFTVGLMLATQLPELNYFKKITDTIKNDEGEIGSDFLKDIVNIPFGFDFQMPVAQLGINTSKFLLEGLYFGFKFSKFDTDWINGVIPLSGFSFRTMSIGFNVSYQLISKKRLLAGLLVWRGINLGTGFIWQNTSLNITTSLKIDDVKIPVQVSEEINMPVNGVIRLNFETNNYIVPIEAMTSIRLIGFLNMAFGAGVDIAFGSSNINTSGSLDVVGKPSNLPLGVDDMKDPPILKFNPLAGKSNPNIINVKGLFAAGFNFGPVIIDIPVTYYFLSNGWSLGLTFGVTL